MAASHNISAASADALSETSANGSEGVAAGKNPDPSASCSWRRLPILVFVTIGSVLACLLAWPVFVSEQPEPAQGKVEFNNATVLKHDFGLLRPGEVASHPFVIRNNTETPWEISRVLRTCNCTVSEASANVVPAGGEIKMVVRYRASTTSSDERKRVTVVFKDASVTPIVLETNAKIRAPLTVSRSAIRLIGSSFDHTINSYFEIQNYSPAIWEGVSAESSAPWLHTRVVPIVTVGNSKDTLAPRQYWRVVLSADVAALAPGVHRTIVNVKSISQETLATSVPLVLTVRNPVVVVPSQLFFGTIKRGESSTVSVTLHFAPDILLQSHDAENTPRARYNGGGKMSFQWIETSNRHRWRLVATLDPTSVHRYLKGVVVVSLSKQHLQPVRIPVHAVVE